MADLLRGAKVTKAKRIVIGMLTVCRPHGAQAARSVPIAGITMVCSVTVIFTKVYG